MYTVTDIAERINPTEVQSAEEAATLLFKVMGIPHDDSDRISRDLAAFTEAVEAGAITGFGYVRIERDTPFTFVEHLNWIEAYREGGVESVERLRAADTKRYADFEAICRAHDLDAEAIADATLGYNSLDRLIPDGWWVEDGDIFKIVVPA